MWRTQPPWHACELLIVRRFETFAIHSDLLLFFSLKCRQGVLAGLAGIIVAGIANTSRYNTDENYDAVFYYVDEPGKQAGLQAAFLFITLGMATTTGLLTGLMAKAACGRLQPRVYNDDRFFEKAFR